MGGGKRRLEHRSDQRSCPMGHDLSIASHSCAPCNTTRGGATLGVAAVGIRECSTHFHATRTLHIMFDVSGDQCVLHLSGP